MSDLKVPDKWKLYHASATNPDNPDPLMAKWRDADILKLLAEISSLDAQLAALRRDVTDEECRALENSYGEKLMLNFVEWGLSEFIESRARIEASSAASK